MMSLKSASTKLPATFSMAAAATSAASTPKLLVLNRICRAGVPSSKMADEGVCLFELEKWGAAVACNAMQCNAMQLLHAMQHNSHRTATSPQPWHSLGQHSPAS
jgi:hypothetical protein